MFLGDLSKGRRLTSELGALPGLVVTSRGGKKKLRREGSSFGPQTRKLGLKGWIDYSEGITIKVMKIITTVY